jgi:hypothetical protein
MADIIKDPAQSIKEKPGTRFDSGFQLSGMTTL